MAVSNLLRRKSKQAAATTNDQHQEQRTPEPQAAPEAPQAPEIAAEAPEAPDAAERGAALQYPVVVATPEELSAAYQRKAERIVVVGELAAKLGQAFNGLRKLSASALNTLALVVSGAALLAPFTGGVSLGAAGTVMGTLGAALTASAIAAISAIGVALVVAVFKGYDEVKLKGGSLELVLRKRKDAKQ